MSSSLTTRLPGLAKSRESDAAPVAANRQAIGVDVTDEALLAQICDGSREALADLFRRYARIVRGVAYRILRDTSEADDLLQDIFLLIHCKCGMFDASRGPARFWILQMTYHRAIARRRYLNSRHFYTRVDLDDVERELAAPGIASQGLGDSGDGLLGREGFQKVLEDLSENQRKTLQLFFVEGHTLGEIAMKLNQTRGNVKNHYFRGLEKLRKWIFGDKLRRGSAV
ncbi:MAG TPA: sigma-70 family RNA polymerase sigma factor [Candidatus Sulfotelmatobacter sp.]|nr:sigma-70 family RNA polymerase sigma factor [Candidatus Sulfotelmatobacter sp.]